MPKNYREFRKKVAWKNKSNKNRPVLHLSHGGDFYCTIKQKQKVYDGVRSK